MSQTLKIARVRWGSVNSPGAVPGFLNQFHRKNFRGQSRIVGNLFSTFAAAAGYPFVRQSNDGVHWDLKDVIPQDLSQLGAFVYRVNVALRLPYVEWQFVCAEPVLVNPFRVALEAVPDDDESAVVNGGGGGGGGTAYTTAYVNVNNGAIQQLAALLATGDRVRISLPQDPPTLAGGRNNGNFYLYYNGNPAVTDSAGVNPGTPMQPGDSSGWLDVKSALYGYASGGNLRVLVERESG